MSNIIDVVVYVISENPSSAARGRVDAGQDIQRGGFAGSVVSKNAEYFVDVHIEVELVDGLERAEFLAERFDLDCDLFVHEKGFLELRVSFLLARRCLGVVGLDDELFFNVLGLQTDSSRIPLLILLEFLVVGALSLLFLAARSRVERVASVAHFIFDFHLALAQPERMLADPELIGNHLIKVNKRCEKYEDLNHQEYQ